VFGAYGFGQAPFAGLISRVRVRPPGGRVGHGGSGMSDEEFRRLLRRLGAVVSDDLTDDELVQAAAAFLMLDAL